MRTLAGLALLLLISCGGGQTPAESTTPTVAPGSSESPATAIPGDQAAVASPADAGSPNAPSPSVANDAGGPPAAGSDRPFASSNLEATHLIDDAVEQRHKEMEACAVAARERRKTPHAEVIIELGIDQEGSLIGVKSPKGAPKDNVLLDCVRAALNGAAFPRSKAGVITLRKRFTEQPVHPVKKEEPKKKE